MRCRPPAPANAPKLLPPQRVGCRDRARGGLPLVNPGFRSRRGLWTRRAARHSRTLSGLSPRSCSAGTRTACPRPRGKTIGKTIGKTRAGPQTAPKTSKTARPTSEPTRRSSPCRSASCPCGLVEDGQVGASAFQRGDFQGSASDASRDRLGAPKGPHRTPSPARPARPSQTLLVSVKGPVRRGARRGPLRVLKGLKSVVRGTASGRRGAERAVQGRLEAPAGSVSGASQKRLGSVSGPSRRPYRVL
jgi:hypothetical protein